MPDALGRLHVPFPRTGPLHVICRSQHFQKSTIEPHLNDLVHICPYYLGSNRSILILIADNGPDWSWNSLANCLSITRVFQELNLDALFVVSYAPGQSALNMIEHAWSHLTVSLSGLHLPACLLGEEKPPMNQKGLTEEEKERKLAIVMDNAMSRTCAVLNKLHFDGFPIKASFQPCLKKNQPFSDYLEVKEALETVRAFQEHQKVRELFHFFLKHADRRLDCLILKKCGMGRDNPCDYCKRQPVKSREAIKFLQKHPSFPDPISNVGCSGHFYTFLDHVTDHVIATGEPDQAFYRRQKVANRLAAYQSRCPLCSAYTFRSVKDLKTHFAFAHRGKPLPRAEK